MIRSMTAFGNAKADLSRHAGARTAQRQQPLPRPVFPPARRAAPCGNALRELLTAQLARGKVEIRVSFTRNASADMSRLDPAWLETLSEQLQAARRILPDIASPRRWNCSTGRPARQRRARSPGLGRRLPAGCPTGADAVARRPRARRPAPGRDDARVRRRRGPHRRDRGKPPAPIAGRASREAGRQAARERGNRLPGGFNHISGAELSERLAQEANLFALRIDVAEELSRLRSHLEELRHLLGDGGGKPASARRTPAAPASGWISCSRK